jgi:hypothetical protein
MRIVEHIIRAIVDTIPEIQLNGNLSAKPKFHWGDEKELNRYIALKNEESYPLIWLLPDSDKSEVWDGRRVVRDCTFIIATREVRKELFNDQRYIKTFDLVLNPLTENLIYGLSTSNITDRMNEGWTITKFPNYSADSEANGTIDYWDAIKLDISIRFYGDVQCLKPILY